MSDNPVKTHSVLIENYAFIAGINWRPISLRETRHLKKIARRERADLTVINKYRDADGNVQYLAGLLKKSSLKIPNKVNKIYSLGLYLSSFFQKNGYVILRLDENLFSFFGYVNGTLYNDVVGNKINIEQAKDTYINFNISSVPDDGWLIFAPDDWGIEGAVPFELSSQVNKKKLSAASKFKPASNIKTGLLVSAVAVLGAGVYFFTHQYQEMELERVRQEQREAILLEQQKNQPRIIPPWTTTPDLNEFVRTCSTHWQSLPLSIAGWVFQEAQCSREKLRMAYRKPAGVTVADFSTRLKYLYQGKHTPYFNIPGQGDAGGFSVSLTMVDAGNIEVLLPSADEQTQRIVSFMQRQRIPITLSEEDNRIISPNGEETILPWRSFNFNFETVVPPQYLFSGFNGEGIRLESITVSLNKGRLTYKLEGHIYANP